MQSQENGKGKVNTPDLAKGKKKPLTVTFFIGDKQIEKLTDEQCERMAAKVGKAMSVYYTSHIEEYKRI